MPDRFPDTDLTINRFGHQNDPTPLPLQFRFVHSIITTDSATTITHASMASNTFRFANSSISNSHTSAFPTPKMFPMPEHSNNTSSLSQHLTTGFWIIIILTCLGAILLLILGFLEVMRKDNVQEPGMAERETRRVEYQLRNGNIKLDHIVVKVVAVAKQLDSVGKRLNDVHERMDGVYEALCALTELEELLRSGMERTQGDAGVDTPGRAGEGELEDLAGGEKGSVDLEDRVGRLPVPVSESGPGADISEEGMEPDSENVEKSWRRHLRSKGYDVNA